MSKQPERRRTLDIETSPRLGLFFGSTYKPNIAKVILESAVLGFSVKGLHKKVKSYYIWDYPEYYKIIKPKDHSLSAYLEAYEQRILLAERHVVKKWIEEVSGQLVIGQNSRSFDDKVMMGRVIIHELEPPIPFQTIDTMADTKAIARFDSNKLDDVSKMYGFGGKNDTGGIELWWACMNGDKKAQKKMVKYCERDVELTEKRYLREMPYYKRHPAMNVLEQKPQTCPRCTKDSFAVSNAYTSSKLQLTYQYHRCRNCGYAAKVKFQGEQEKATYI